MKRNFTFFSLVLLGLATALIWVWQYGSWRRFRQTELDAAARYEKVVHAALSVSIHRQCKRLVSDLEDLHATFNDLRIRVEASYLAVFQIDGTPFIEAGQPRPPDDPAIIDRRKPIEIPPHLTEPIDQIFKRNDGGTTGKNGFSRCGDCGIPADLDIICLQYPSSRLQGLLDQGWHRFILASTTTTLAFLFLFLFYLSRRRTAGLREELVGAAERVRSLEFLSRLGAGLAHETKNPLGSIRGFGEMLKRRDLPSTEIRQAANRIVDESDRIVSRLDEFLLLSRPARPRMENFDLAEMLDDLAQLVRPELEAKQATLDLVGKPMLVDADREQVRRLFLNLLVNALEFIDRNGAITIRMEGDRVVVADDGPGVDAKIRDTLFEPYVSGRPGGTGLGLAIARRIALEHEWWIRYEPGGVTGTRMIVEVGQE